MLFRDGEPADFAFLLQTGRVRLFKQVGAMERSLRVARAGDLFGESALMRGATRRSTAVALDDSTAIAVDHATFENVLADPQVGLIFLIPGNGDTLRVTGRGRLYRRVRARQATFYTLRAAAIAR